VRTTLGSRIRATRANALEQRSSPPDPTAALANALADALADTLADAHGVSARTARVVDPNTARGRPGSTGLTGARVEVRERGACEPAQAR